MLTTNENRPIVGKVFTGIAITIGSLGILATISASLFVLVVGRGKDSAAVVTLLSVGSIGVLALGAPCGAYGLWCNRTRLAWIGLVLCGIPLLCSFLLGFIAGGNER